jgi:hypothetical protein
MIYESKIHKRNAMTAAGQDYTTRPLAKRRWEGDGDQKRKRNQLSTREGMVSSRRKLRQSRATNILHLRFIGANGV